MPESTSSSQLLYARQNTASALAGVVAALERLQPGRADAGAYAQRSSITEALGVLRQMLRLLSLIQAAQTAAARSASLGGVLGGGGSGGGGGGGGGIGGFFGSLLGGITKGLGIASLALGIVGLFRGGRKASPEPTAYNAPEPLSLEVANTDEILRGFPRFDYTAAGQSRPVEELPPAFAGTAAAPPAVFAEAREAPLRITVNVNAMDARSFQDHAPALAQAVRDAMLHMHPINQLVREAF